MDDINTNISDYTLDDLFSLLDISIDTDSTYDDLTNKIKKNTNTYIQQFTKLNKPVIANFFKNVQDKLLNSSTQNDITNSSVIEYQHNYVYGQPGSNTVTNDMYNANNGAGNPIHRKTVTKLYNVDSRFRENYDTSTSTNYSVVIPEEQKGVIEMKLCDLELPTTYYPFNNAYSNNYMWIKVTDTNQNDTYLYVYIPEGNYYFTNFVGYIQFIFASTDFKIAPLGIFFDMTYDNAGGVGEGTGLIQLGIFGSVNINANNFITEGGTIINIELNFTAPPILNYTTSRKITDPELLNLYSQTSPIPLNQKLGWMLGYRKGLYTGAISYKSESILDIIGPRYLYLSVDDHRFSINSNFKPCNNSNLPGTIMARLSLKGAAFNIQTQNDFSVYSEPRYYFGPVNISKFDIKLLDEHGRIIDLNNNDFSFTLRLTVIYSAT
jgi:hypothetical protein